MKNARVYILVRGRNAEPYLWSCLNSILSQTYSNLQILFIDDASEYSRQTKEKITQLLRSHIVIWQKKRMYSLYNAAFAIKKFCTDPNGIVIKLDADDWFARSDAVELIVNGYHKTRAVIGYGDCFIQEGNKLDVASKITLHNHLYAPEIILNASYRDHSFVPMHPLSWKVYAFRAISEVDFQRSDKSWLSYAEDLAIFFPLLEMYGKRCFVSPIQLTVYNANHPNADVKINTLPLLKDELEIRRKRPYASVAD